MVHLPPQPATAAVKVRTSVKRPGFYWSYAGVVSGRIMWAIAPSLLALVACSAPPTEPPLDIRLYQQWELQPGDRISDYTVLGGLGDIAIALNGNPAYAPFNGRTQLDTRQCVIFSSPDVPAYLFRLCGLTNPKLGTLNQGEAIGRGDRLQFATLRKQPNGTWAMVEPAKAILERTLRKA